MVALSLFSILLALAVVHDSSAEFPADIKKCQPADGACIIKTANEIISAYPNGYPEIGLAKIEPYHLDELVVAKRDGKSPLNLDLRFDNLDVHGLSKAVFSRFVGLDKDPRKSKVEAQVTVPLITLRGQYEANGKILLLPVKGKGNAEIQIKNLKTEVKLKMATTSVNGKTMVTISKIKILVDIESMKSNFENLFNDNKALGDELNRVINTNWRDVWTELEGGINQGFVTILKQILNGVFQKLSYDEIFSD